MSIEAGTCCESGEELFTEIVLPLGHDQHQLPSRFKRTLAVVAACFERVHAAADTMTQRVGLVLENHLSGFVQRERETSHPRDETPHETWRYYRLMRVRRDLRVHGRIILLVGALQWITDQASVVFDDTAIRGP